MTRMGATDDVTIRVLVVDDDDLFRIGLASILDAEPDMEVAAHASSGRMGVRLAAELRPDLVLIDARMPGLKGPDAIRQILMQHPDTRVVALTLAARDNDVAEAVAAGASGFLAKDTPVSEFVIAVRAIARGASWLSPRAAQVILGRIRREDSRPKADTVVIERLSSRELDVLRLLAQGSDNAAIGRALGISPRTATNHVSRILAKLEVPTRVQAAVYAAHSGLV